MKKSIVLVVFLLAGCRGEALPVNAPETLRASASITSAYGQSIGEVRLEQTDDGVLLNAVLKNLPSGVHGIHIHTVGKCVAPSFESAGAHYNPTQKQHGIENEHGPHAGDLPNLTVDANGEVELEFVAQAITLKELLDEDGSAIVIHERADDYKTDPSGNSGERIACGVIK